MSVRCPPLNAAAHGPTARKNCAALVTLKPGMNPLVLTSVMFVNGPQLTFGSRLDFCWMRMESKPSFHLMFRTRFTLRANAA